MEGKLAVCILVAWSVGSVVQSTNTSSHASFLTCPSDIVQNCRVTGDRCKKGSYRINAVYQMFISTFLQCLFH